jgi:alkylation response protein AidB-like acyl-CoA dehydrogenase
MRTIQYQRLADYKGTLVDYRVRGSIATIALNYPERKNQLSSTPTLELRDLFRDMGCRRGASVERLYHEIRALRIYEGASEVLKYR